MPLLASAAALFWPREGPLPAAPGLRAPAFGALAAIGVLLAWSNVSKAWDVGNRYIDPPPVFDRIAKLVRDRVPAGSLLFTDDPFLTGVLYASLPEYQYIVAYDPAVLFTASPRLFWRWHHSVVNAVACEERDCPGERAGPDAVAAVIRSFGSSWAITSYPKGAFSMQAVMAQGDPLFELAGASPGPITGLYLWSVRAPAEAARLRGSASTADR